MLTKGLTRVSILTARGPFTESGMLYLVRRCSELDGIICGDDVISRRVLRACGSRLKVVSKYGVGVDKIDVRAASHLGVRVTNCPGVNAGTVAEHCMALLLALSRHLVKECSMTYNGFWTRLTGFDLQGKTLGLVGFGNVAREVCARACAFNMKVACYDKYWSATQEQAAQRFDVTRFSSLAQLLQHSDVVSLHTVLTAETHRLINHSSIALMKPSAFLINTARGKVRRGDEFGVMFISSQLWVYKMW